MDGGRSNRVVVKANELLGTEHLVHGRAVPATATALESTTVLIVQRKDIDKLCDKDERFRQALIMSAWGSSHSKAEVALTPPEGAVGPSRFGCTSLTELGWKRQLDALATGSANLASPQMVPVAPSPVRSLPPATPCEGEGDDDIPVEDDDPLCKSGLLAPPDLQDLLVSAAASAGDHDPGEHDAHGGAHGVKAAIMIWLGILIDGVPESLVMGILVNTAEGGTLMTFVCGVFLANFPEAMSSAGIMCAHGMRKWVIMCMWSSICLLTGIGASVGAAAFPTKGDPTMQKVIAGIEGLCGGAMLCMIANTVLPEAFEQGGNVVGLSTLLGFLVAISVSVAQ
eukprot:gnl/TRDRNA2_/TRDRNA2_134404_c3_seq1.p1 gnl/TRDRNA2_/TRDRNA2_134404_c3~~gnl/TRDRNA2_/TRDRNA2_134404_c3_seq1.p1  ORF type:complete len:357 (-),score=68.73 gnl/TRDRNA2_/TRDRNA2_134404_c3_seq1:45-1064(-)